ncbi:MAG: cytochrome c, partial [Deltaproteobacteria bacterium]|nr:cytochrome c [Deltaproteobacteria bacterium]
MLSKSAARSFFLVGTLVCVAFFIGLTVDTLGRVPAQTNAQNLTESVKLGKKLWEKNNCMGCHTLLGEGAYYAPELTKVYERRGPQFMRALLKDPQAMYPGERKMVKYNLTDPEIDQLIAFFKWIGEMDLNGFPPKPHLVQLAVTATSTGGGVAQASDRPFVFNQMCVACHTMG